MTRSEALDRAAVEAMPNDGSVQVFDTVVFDVDGTLVDTNYLHVIAWLRAFATLGPVVPTWRLHHAIGMGGDRLVAEVAGDLVEADRGDDIRAAWEQEYDALLPEVRPFPLATTLLAECRDRGLSVTLASSGIPRHTRHALDVLESDEHSDHSLRHEPHDLGDVVGAATDSEDASSSKPDPELLEEAIGKVSGSSAFLVGDSVWDCLAARRAGLPIVGLLCGGFGRDELLAAGASVVREAPNDLLAHLDETLAALATPLPRPRTGTG